MRGSLGIQRVERAIVAGFAGVLGPPIWERVYDEPLVGEDVEEARVP